MNKVLITLFFIVSIFSQVPQWVDNYPIVDTAYVGIGFGLKSNPDYIKDAKKEALSDLISSISLTVSSESEYSKYENNFYEDSYQQTIKRHASSKLKGHKLIDTYENDDYYWVYYAITKQAYKDYLQSLKDAQNRISFYIENIEGDQQISPNKNQSLINKLSKVMTNESFNLASNKNDASYIIKVESNFYGEKSFMGLKFIYGNFGISLVDSKSNKTIYTKSLDDIKGGHRSTRMAINSSVKNAVRRFNINQLVKDFSQYVEANFEVN